MIHSASPIVTPVANIAFCCLVFLDLKSGDGRTDVRTTSAKTMIPTGHDSGLAKWIKKQNITPFSWVYRENTMIYCFLNIVHLINNDYS